MKIKDLHEARLATQQKFAYVELLEDRMGDTSAQRAVIPGDVLRRIATDDEAFEDWAEGQQVYMLGGVLQDYWDSIKEDLSKQGYWSGEIEEGSAAFSAKGPKHAMQLAKAAFVQLPDDDDEEDW